MEARYLGAIQKLYPPNLHEAMLESFRRFSLKGAEEAVKIKKK